MDKTVLVAVSDLHVSAQTSKVWLAARVNQIRRLKPDIVVILGDFFEGHGPVRDELLPVLKQVRAPLGVWMVSGNHEFHGNRNTNMRLIAEAGFHLLRNRWAQIRPGFVLAGVDDLTAARRSGRGKDWVSKVLADHPPGSTILLSHTPWTAERAAEAGADLMLCGHTHGGQIWPFGYLVRLRYPLLSGQYTVAGMPVIVCRGTGTWGPRMRLWYPGEILRVTLRAATEPAGGL